jgi:hypothetical protein
MGPLAKPVRVSGQLGSKLLIARPRSVQYSLGKLALAPLRGALDHPRCALEDVGDKFLRHERIMEVMPLVIRLALLLERLTACR